MGTSKILIDGVGIDLTADTVTAAHLEQGYTAHDASGDIITGTLTPSQWEGLMPSIASVSEIAISWTDGKRLNNGVETATSTESVTDYIDISDCIPGGNTYLLLVSKTGQFKETGFNLLGAYYNSSQTFTRNLTFGTYSVRSKFLCIQPHNTADKFIRIQADTAFKPQKIYKITFKG